MSRVFVPILSRDAIKSEKRQRNDFEFLHSESSCDNVLLGNISFFIFLLLFFVLCIVSAFFFFTVLNLSLLLGVIVTRLSFLLLSFLFLIHFSLIQPVLYVSICIYCFFDLIFL
jgi:hypothetical protein